jgi:hypothetical protein
VSNTAKLFVNANYNGQWGGQQELVPPRFDLTTQQNLNLRAGLEYGKITISGFANNITNESYVLYYSTTTRRYNQPRTMEYNCMSDGNGLWMPTRRGLMAAGGMGLMAAALPGWAADEAGTPLYRAAREAWLYALPLVQIGGYRARQMAKGNRPNVLVYQDSLSTPASRDVTTPNVDTLYAGALIDLGSGPVTLTLPPTGKRYASVALMDFWSNNFAVLGTRTTGPDGGRFTLVGPEGAARAGALRSPRAGHG